MIQKFEEFVSINESEKKQSMKSKAIDFVEEKGKATWKEIYAFLMTANGFDPNDRGNRGKFSSYFSDSKAGGTNLFFQSSNRDPRFLQKGEDGYYIVAKALKEDEEVNEAETWETVSLSKLAQDINKEYEKDLDDEGWKYAFEWVCKKHKLPVRDSEAKELADLLRKKYHFTIDS